MCVCVCAFVRGCVRARMCMCVCVRACKHFKRKTRGGGYREKDTSRYRDTSCTFILETERGQLHTCSNTVGKSTDVHSSLIHSLVNERNQPQACMIIADACSLKHPKHKAGNIQ